MDAVGPPLAALASRTSPPTTATGDVRRPRQCEYHRPTVSDALRFRRTRPRSAARNLATARLKPLLRPLQEVRRGGRFPAASVSEENVGLPVVGTRAFLLAVGQAGQASIVSPAGGRGGAAVALGTLVRRLDGQVRRAVRKSSLAPSPAGRGSPATCSPRGRCRPPSTTRHRSAPPPLSGSVIGSPRHARVTSAGGTASSSSRQARTRGAGMASPYARAVAIHVSMASWPFCAASA